MTVRELLEAAQKLSLSDRIRLAGQLVQQVVQNLEQPATEHSSPVQTEDPIVGMFAGPPELASQSEDILRRELNSTSGYTWKK